MDESVSDSAHNIDAERAWRDQLVVGDRVAVRSPQEKPPDALGTVERITPNLIFLSHGRRFWRKTGKEHGHGSDLLCRRIVIPGPCISPRADDFPEDTDATRPAYEMALSRRKATLWCIAAFVAGALACLAWEWLL